MGVCKIAHMSPYIRTVRTQSGATAVQIIYSRASGKRTMDHVGSAHTDHELAVLMAQAQRIIDKDQYALDFGDQLTPRQTGTTTNPVPVTGQKAGYLLDAIDVIYSRIGLDAATDGDGVFKNLVTARIIHPGSKLDSIETLDEVGVTSASYRTITRALPVYATPDFQAKLTTQLATHAQVGRGTFVLYDVTTLYFETDKADELRKPGFSKERRLEPQITVGMLTDNAGFPLEGHAFEGNRAETTTMIPMIEAFQKTYGLETITIVADAGMFSASNKKAIVDAGLDYILGVKFKDVPYPVEQWRKEHPEVDYSDGQIWTHHNRGDRGPYGSLKGIDEQVAKAEKAVAGKIAVKRNRYVDLRAPAKRVNYTLANKNRALAGIKGYETSRVDLSAEEVIDAYRQLIKVEKSFVGCQNRILKPGRFFTARLIRLLLTWR